MLMPIVSAQVAAGHFFLLADSIVACQLGSLGQIRVWTLLVWIEMGPFLLNPFADRTPRWSSVLYLLAPSIYPTLLL